MPSIAFFSKKTCGGVGGMREAGLANVPVLLLVLVLMGGMGMLSTLLPINARVAHAQTDMTTLQHTSPTLDITCKSAYYSRDGNPFQLCPGPFPGGGNCVWWAWEQWHLLGYDLPLNWGNAADWVVDAERAGLPVGTQPRLGSIAVFPRADGVWAYGPPGHVAFVTYVSPDGMNFNVTYQNYGDPTPVHFGTGYNVPTVNTPKFQDGLLRFIYLPIQIDLARFSHLVGVNGNGLNEVAATNAMLSTTRGTDNTGAGNNADATTSASRLTLGLPTGSGSAEQEYNADFTGTGVSDLLLYNRQQGSLDVLSFSPQQHIPRLVSNELDTSTNKNRAQRVSLADATTATHGWGSSLDVRVGDFAGTGESDILLYDRSNGKIQLLTLTPQFTIKKHVTLNGWGPNWELSVGRFDGKRSGVFLYNRFADANVPIPVEGTNQSNLTLDQWYAAGRTANAVMLDFNADLSVRHIQQYTQWHNSWEVYVGRFKNASQDGVFLYDRGIGEARLMDFNDTMQISDYQELHNLVGNWQVFNGDFNGSGRSQVLLYDPSQGNGKFLVFNPDLSLAREQSYSGWKVNDVFYVGHFGTARMNAMLYDPQAGTSTFIVFNDALKIMQLYTVQSWDQHWQILVGAFVDRASCAVDANCTKDDNILVLNRRTGEMVQYSFTFGHQYKVLDSRSQAFVRSGNDAETRYRAIDTTTFKAVGTFSTTISGEELY